jgi:hypothetical protein
VPSAIRACLPVLVLFSAACTGPTVVNTEEPTSQAPAPAAAQTSTTRPSNAHLANAFAYSTTVDGATDNDITTPSARSQ